MKRKLRLEWEKQLLRIWLLFGLAVFIGQSRPIEALIAFGLGLYFAVRFVLWEEPAGSPRERG